MSSRTLAAGEKAMYVVATSAEGTNAALTAAVRLTRREAATLVVLVPHVVPYAAPIEDLSSAGVFAANRCRDFVRGLGAEARIHLCLCRRLDDALTLLPPGATVIIGEARRSWLPSAEQRLARRLRQTGHALLFAAAEAPVRAHARRAGFAPGRS